MVNHRSAPLLDSKLYRWVFEKRGDQLVVVTRVGPRRGVEDVAAV